MFTAVARDYKSCKYQTALCFKPYMTA